jgi:PhzF family phenazine biosynthesis protein
MKLPIFQIDAFTSKVFAGNPAAVVPLADWLPDATLQSIALENNLSETAFFVGADGKYQLRWFTPKVEVDLCGHATLATAWLIFQRLAPSLKRIEFGSRSGTLAVTRDGEQLTLDFPSMPAVTTQLTPDLGAALGKMPTELLTNHRVSMCVFDDAETVRGLKPDFGKMRKLDKPFVIATAPGGGADFVSRFFAPTAGIDEDPVTGSAHCTLVPYWAGRLSKRTLHAKQISARGGELFCERRGDRVAIAGSAVLYLEGTIFV